MAINEAEYLAANPDVAYGISQGWFPSAAAHYAAVGASEGRQTAPTPAYTPDPALRRLLPPLRPSSSFDSAAQPTPAPDPAPSFDSAAYLSTNPDVAYGIQQGWFGSAQEHYANDGAREGRSLAPAAQAIERPAYTPDLAPSSSFASNEIYLRDNPDVMAWAQAQARATCRATTRQAAAIP